VRLLQPVFSSRLEMWLSIVRWLSLSCSAMQRLLPPEQTQSSTSFSAGVIRADMQVMRGCSGFPAADVRRRGRIGLPG
jgi:hypothetical protein